MKHQRKIKNFLISPLLQFKISGFFVLISLLLFVFLVGFAHHYWTDTINIMVEMSGIEQETRNFIEMEITGFLVQLSVILIFFFIVLVVFVVHQTHRFLGASYAIRKFIDENLLKGNYQSNVKIREADYLQEIAESLNKYVEQKRN